MFFLALSLLVFVNFSAETCIEEPFIGLLDCSDLSLKTIDGLFTTRQLWIRAVDFSENNFAVINTTELLLVFPNLQHIDLRRNLALDCRAIWDSKVRVRSDCMFPPLSLTTSTFDVIICFLIKKGRKNRLKEGSRR
jgi:hypothetical protein